ncbi:MFS transporter [Microvirga arabica]|uniref:MFS transporter n=1 Tax=Microvirga arabica TaxID=1128671 RepID=UPI00193A3835|nr:MFS transporter [Microvirga arabica]MBM1173483.1 MFS transporter [Microvirga arabica]
MIVSRRGIIFSMMMLCAVLSLAGTDLILPAVPALPAIFATSEATAQLVLASYVAGTAIGLLLFGALADRLTPRTLVVSSLVVFAMASMACALSPSIWALIVLRFVQGAASAAAPVFGPAIIRQIFSEKAGVRAIGFLGSVESLVPALAPILGLFLLARFGWQSSFELVGVVAIVAAALIFVLGLPRQPKADGAQGSYGALLLDPVFMRYALSQAMTLAGLLVFVFGAPAVIVGTMGGTLHHFIAMQVSGVLGFIVAANLTSRCAERWGTERIIYLGTAMSLASAVTILAYALAGGNDSALLPALFLPMNVGLGLRGPLGFYRGIVASGTNSARGSALIVFFILAATSLGTMVAAPFINQGLGALSAVTCGIHALSVGLLLLLPEMPEPN